MEINRFGDLSTRVLECFASEQFEEAYRLVNRHRNRFPEERWHVDYWRMILAVLVGRGEEANPILRVAVEDGMWWPERYLGQDEFSSYLDSTLVETCLRRGEIARSQSSPRLLIRHAETDSSPSRWLFIIHRNHSNAEREMAHWLPAHRLGWSLAVPQSSQLVGRRVHVWDDRSQAITELAAHWQSLLDQGLAPDLAVIAGYVTGGTLAVRLALEPTKFTNRFIALSPYVPDLNETLQPKLQTTGAASLRGVISIGILDSRCYPGALQLAEKLQDTGAAIDLRQFENLSQDYPPNFSTFLRQACEHLFE